MGAGFYRAAREALRVPRAACVREFVTGRERAARAGPFIIACSHLSHLEPVFVSAHVARPIRWMAREEFSRPWAGRVLLGWCGAFSVDRFGDAAPAVRRAIALLGAGEVVGVFPEGGVAQGQRSVLRGGPIKGGVCTVAVAAGVPVVPVVVLGVEKLNRVRPWLPTRSARVWMAFGEDVAPGVGGSRRARRLEMMGRVRAGFMAAYRGLLGGAGLRDEQVP